MKRLTQHLTVANVLSCMALFVALSGAAYAATTLKKNQVKATNIAKEAVTKPKLKKEAVTSGKIKNLGINANDIGSGAVINSKLAKKAVTGAKLGSEAVSAEKLAKDSVTNAKLGPEAVTTGKLGSEAVTASKLAVWSQLLKNVTYVTETSVNDSESAKTVTATCPTGKEVLGGGVKINGGSTDPKAGVAPSVSAPVTSSTNSRVGWEAGGREIGEENLNWQVVAYAICAEL